MINAIARICWATVGHSITHPIIFCVVIYLFLGFYTFGNVFNHHCDNESHTDIWIGRTTEYAHCQLLVGLPAFGAGVAWPIYWTSVFFIWITE